MLTLATCIPTSGEELKDNVAALEGWGLHRRHRKDMVIRGLIFGVHRTIESLFHNLDLNVYILLLSK